MGIVTAAYGRIYYDPEACYAFSERLPGWDLYFRVTSPDHNLIRARNQMALAQDMERKLPQMQQIVAELRKK